MSVMRDCTIIEVKPGNWYYDIENTSCNGESEVFGPFDTFDAADEHMGDNHSNPGGFCSIEYSKDECEGRLKSYCEEIVSRAQSPSRSNIYGFGSYGMRRGRGW